MANGKPGRPKKTTPTRRPPPPKVHEKRGAGRPKGSLNHRTLMASSSLAEHARTFTRDATAEIFRLMRHADSEQVRLAAAIHLLDRGYGKPFQSVQIMEQSDVNITYRTAEDLRRELVERGIPQSLLVPDKRISRDEALDAEFDDVTDEPVREAAE